MKTIFFFVVVCCCSLSAWAQDESNQGMDGRTWTLTGGDSRYVFADTAYVRVSPDTKQAPADTLFAGDEIIIGTVTDKLLTLKGLSIPWIQIKYKKNGTDKEGFLWQGLISFKPMRRGDVKFVFGIDRHTDTTIVSDGTSAVYKQFVIKLKAVQAGKVTATKTFRIFDDEAANYADAKIMSGLGLSNVQNIIALSFGGEACGIPNNYYYFAWMNNNRLAVLPERMEVGDAGAYYHMESFVFPGEKTGEPDTIIWNVSEEEATDDVDKKGEPVMKATKYSGKYSWDGVNGTFKKTGKWRS